MYTALYLPSSSIGYNPTKGGFSTEDSAWDYVFDNMCKDCKEEREKALKGEMGKVIIDDKEEEMEYSTHPACACEWMVAKTEELEKCTSMREVFELMGCPFVEKDEQV